MNTRVVKSFGLALLVAVGILALMLALGTFNAPKAGAQATDQVDMGSIEIESATPASGATVQVQLTFNSGSDATGNFGTLEIELEGYGIPSQIDPKHVLIRTPASGTDPDNGNPVDVTVSGGVITLELNDDDDDGTADIEGDVDGVIIVLRSRIGIMAPALAGTYDVRIGEETNENAVTVSASLSLDPAKGGSSTEIEVSGKAFADGTGTLYTEMLTNPDGNNDGIIDALIAEGDSPTNPDDRSTGGYTLDTDGDGEANFHLRLEDNETGGDDDEYVAVPIQTGAGLSANVDDLVTEDLGYKISLAPAPTQPATTPLEGTPTLPAATYDTDNAEELKDVTVDDGEFSTTIDAEDLVIGGNEGRSRIRMTDANGDMARAVFQVTGTVTLGSDSVGKGKLLKISLSEWITDVPNLVKIGGVMVAITDEDGDAVEGETIDIEDADDTDQLTEAYLEFFGLGDGDADDDAVSFYVKVGGDVGLGSKTVVLFHRVTETDNQGTTGTDEPEPTDDEMTHTDTRLNSSNVEITALGLSVAPTTAVAGQQVTVEGTGFSTATDNQLATLTVGGIPQTELSNRNDVDEYDVLSGGRIVISFAVPAEVTEGSNTIRITDEEGRVGEVALTVPEPMITLDPTSSRRATTVTVTGTGFPAGENISVDYGEEDDGIASGRTDNTGNFTASFGVPSDAAIGGEIDVTASIMVDGPDDGDETTTYSAEATHSVPDKEITVTPDVVRSGETVQIVGTGFPRYSDVEVKVGEGEFRTTDVRTDEIGDFTTSAIIPGIDPGTHVIQVRAGAEIATWVITVPVGPAPMVSADPADVFADLIEDGTLVEVLQLVRTSDTDITWLFYKPGEMFEDFNTYSESESGDILFVNVSSQTTFQDRTLYTGWNQHVLN